MKLRNKKTGEIGEAYWATFREGGTDLCISMHKNGTYEEVHSLAELNERWEDYKPTEPLIKDEKIRKAVRAWSQALCLRGAIFDFNAETMMLRGKKLRACISFDGLDFHEFKHITSEYHTIDELCGENDE